MFSFLRFLLFLTLWYMACIYGNSPLALYWGGFCLSAYLDRFSCNGRICDLLRTKVQEKTHILVDIVTHFSIFFHCLFLYASASEHQTLRYAFSAFSSCFPHCRGDYHSPQQKQNPFRQKTNCHPHLPDTILPNSSSPLSNNTFPQNALHGNRSLRLFP